jgi:hypothetical protein
LKEKEKGCSGFGGGCLAFCALSLEILGFRGAFWLGFLLLNGYPYRTTFFSANSISHFPFFNLKTKQKIQWTIISYPSVSTSSSTTSQNFHISYPSISMLERTVACHSSKKGGSFTHFCFCFCCCFLLNDACGPQFSILSTTGLLSVVYLFFIFRPLQKIVSVEMAASSAFPLDLNTSFSYQLRRRDSF